MRKKLLRLLRIAPLALLFAGVAFAQTTGTLIGVVTDASTGKPVAGALIVAAARTSRASRRPSPTGRQLPDPAASSWRVHARRPARRLQAASAPTSSSASDKTIRANLAVVPEAVQMEEQVVRTGAAPVVNIGSAESGSVVSREFMANVPVGRTVRGRDGHGRPTAPPTPYGVGFAGAQSPENAVHPRRPQRDRPRVRHPRRPARNGPAVAAHELRPGDRRQDRQLLAEYGRATGGVAERRPQVRLERVPRLGLLELHAAHLDPAERQHHRRRRRGRGLALEAEEAPTTSTSASRSAAHHEGQALVLRGLRAGNPRRSGPSDSSARTCCWMTSPPRLTRRRRAAT